MNLNRIQIEPESNQIKFESNLNQINSIRFRSNQIWIWSNSFWFNLCRALLPGIEAKHIKSKGKYQYNKKNIKMTLPCWNVIFKELSSKTYPIKNKCPENVWKIAGKLFGQILDKFWKLNVQKLFQNEFIFRRSEFVQNQFLSGFCPEFIQNFKWKLSRKHPDFSF